MCCFYLSKLDFPTDCLSSTSCSCKVWNERCACLANSLPCADVCKCKYCNNNREDEENNCDDLAEGDEENVYYDSDYSNNLEFEYI